MNRRGQRGGAVALMVCALTLSLSAQTLDRFESGFAPKPDTRSETRTYTSSSRSFGDDLADDFLEGLAEVVFYVGLAGGAYAQQVADERPHGDPILPEFQVNLGAQRVEDGLTAYDYSLAAGRGLGAVAMRHTHFREDLGDETETFDLVQSHLYYRMAFHSRFECGLGFGAAWLKGDKSESGFSFAAPVRFWPLDWLGLELRPAWAGFNGTTLSDIESSLLLRYKQISLQAGYRWLEVENSSADLSGWRAGLSWRF